MDKVALPPKEPYNVVMAVTELKNIIAKTNEYLNIPSVIRYEQPFLQYLKKDFNQSGYTVKQYPGLLSIKRNKKNPQRILIIHIDRHGLVINQNRQFEYAHFNALNFFKMANCFSETFFKHNGQLFINEPVYAYNANTGAGLAEGVITDFHYDYNNKKLWFDIAGLAKTKLPINTPIAYRSKITEHNNYLSGQIDNVISVAIAYQLIKQRADVTILLSCAEEIGRSWLPITNYLASLPKPHQELITIDTTPYHETRALKQGVVVLRQRDEHHDFNKILVSKIEKICKNQHISYEYKDRLPPHPITKTIGKTELGRIIKHSAKRYNGATVQLPTVHYHSNHETTSQLALINYYRLITLLCR